MKILGDLRTDTNVCGLMDGGEGEIRTPETFKGFTRFPGVRLKPLGHLSVKKSALYTNFFRLSSLLNKFISPQL